MAFQQLLLNILLLKTNKEKTGGEIDCINVNKWFTIIGVEKVE